MNCRVVFYIKCLTVVNCFYFRFQLENIDVENVNLHFIAFITINNQLYEMDGRKQFPINHGTTSTDSFLEVCVNALYSHVDLLGQLCFKVSCFLLYNLQDTVAVVQGFMARDPENMRFNMVWVAK